MILDKRRMLAVLSGCGLAVSAAGYIGTFSAASMNNIFLWYIPLLLGWMALFAPIYILEYPASRTLSFAWKGFSRGTPAWVAPCSWSLLLIALAHFVWFAVHSGQGVPAIQDGQYVLDSHGRILKVLTQPEYNKLRAEGARAFATMMIYFYFIPTTYWWFRTRSTSLPPSAC